MAQRVHRLWKQAGLKVVRAKPKRERPAAAGENACSVVCAEYPNHVWTYDFMFDETSDGRKLKFLNVIDEYTRLCLRVEVGRSMTAKTVVRVLAELVQIHGEPGALRSDNGSEFTAQVVKEWLSAAGISTLYIEPGSPWENGYAESFNSRFRSDFLDREIFRTLQEAQVLSETRRLKHHAQTLRRSPPVTARSQRYVIRVNRCDRWPTTATARPPDRPAISVGRGRCTELHRGRGWSCRVSGTGSGSIRSPITDTDMAVLRVGDRWTAVVQVRCPSYVLAERASQDRRVTGWGSLLAQMGQEGSRIAAIQWLERTVPDFRARPRPVVGRPRRPGCGVRIRVSGADRLGRASGHPARDLCRGVDRRP